MHRVTSLFCSWCCIARLLRHRLLGYKASGVRSESSWCVQALPPQPSTRVKRENSTGSFKSPLDQAHASSDRSSDLTSSNNSSEQPSNFKFYQVFFTHLNPILLNPSAEHEHPRLNLALGFHPDTSPLLMELPALNDKQSKASQ